MENHHFSWVNYGKSQFSIGKLWKITMLSMGKSTISMGHFQQRTVSHSLPEVAIENCYFDLPISSLVIFHSYINVYQREKIQMSAELMWPYQRACNYWSTKLLCDLHEFTCSFVPPGQKGLWPIGLPLCMGANHRLVDDVQQ